MKDTQIIASNVLRALVLWIEDIFAQASRARPCGFARATHAWAKVRALLGSSCHGRCVNAVKEGAMKSSQIYRQLNGKLAFSVLSLGICVCWMPGEAISQSPQSQTQAVSQSWHEASDATPIATLAPACGEEDFQAGTQRISVQTGADPGAADPMAVPAGRYQMFPDQGLTAYMRTANGVDLRYFTTDKDASLSLNSSQVLQTTSLDPYGSGPGQFFSTAGRILDPAHDSFVTASRVGNADKSGKVAINFLAEGFSTELEGELLPRQTDSADFLAIAHGDLDEVADSKGNLHDEVVVARVTGESRADKQYYRYRIDVLNYGSGTLSAPEISSDSFAEVAPSFNTNPKGNYSGLLPSDTILSVVVGDFAGNGRKEIALLALGDETLLLYTFRYEMVDGKHKLVLEPPQFFDLESGLIPGPLGSQKLVGTLSAVAGDLSGSGRDELAVAYAKWGPAPSNSKLGGYSAGVLVLKYNAELHANVTSTNWLQATDSTNAGAYEYTSRPRVQLVAGQFLLAPPAIRYGRLQLALGWNFSLSTVNLAALSVSDDAKTITSFGNQTIGSNAGKAFSLVAGGFQGTSGPSPTASLAEADWPSTSPSLSLFYVRTYKVTSGGLSAAGQYKTNALVQYTDSRARFPLVAYDRPGNSRYLGAPAHLTLQSAPETDYLMQEPPKHAYWDEAQHKVVNFTRFDGNNVHLFNSNAASMSTSSTEQSAWSVGGSLAVTAGATGTAGGNWGIAKTKSSVTVDVGLAASYDYNSHEEEYNSGYKERTITSTGQTDRDDYLKGALETIDVWRYRMYGTPTGGDLNAFYEIVLPGPKVDFAGGGLNFDWYQPRHENGNILSYQESLGPPSNPMIPSDMGSYQLPNGTTLKTPQVPAQLRYFDASSGTTELRYSAEVASGGSFTSSHELAESADIKTTYTTSVDTPFGGGEARFCGSAEIHNSNSWGGAKTSTDTTKEETAITLNKVAGQSTTAYPFYPVVYTAADGTTKLSFSVPNPAGHSSNPAGANTFASLYGSLPDPALNLPGRMVPAAAGSGELEKWVPTTTSDRKRMRGLFFRQAKLDPGSNTYPLLAFNPSAGQTVRIEPRVYNYSTGQTAASTVVEFQVIPYNSTNDSEICLSGVPTAGSVCPRAERRTIGRALIPRLEPRQFTCVSGLDDPALTGCAPSAFFNWDTTGFGPPAGSTEYRVYIVLNPDDGGKGEIYGLEPAPVPVTSVKNGTPIVVTAPGNTLETGDYVTIAGVTGVTGANGTFQVTFVSNDEFSLDGTVLSRQQYSGGGTASLLDPGQNNEGYGYLTVARPANLASLTAEERVPHDFLDADALEALGSQGTPGLQATQVTAIQNVPMQLRFTAHSDAVHNDAADMLLFDGDPATGVPALADKVIHPGSQGADGTSVWLSWTPTTTGSHHLYAVLLEGSGERQVTDELQVEVLPTK